jgi:ABC-type nitrate/sulfonate/bicarbonate transport system permease component
MTPLSPVAGLARPARRAKWLPGPQVRVALGSVVVVLVAWQLSGQSGLIDTKYTGTPIAVLRAGKQLVGSGELWSNARVSLVEFGAGLLLAVVVGAPLGMLMGWRLRLRQTLEPALLALYVTPSLALLPLIVLAFGIGETSKIAIVFVEGVITIVVNAMAGIRESDPRLVQTANSFCASRFAVFTKVLLPSALPTIVAGLRLGAGRGVVAVIVGELYAGSQGIGLMVSSYGQSFDIAPLLFVTLAVAVFGYLVSLLLRSLQSAVTTGKG